MSYTSAQSGDNYRNWWPHRTMTDFTNDSIDELDRLSKDSNDIFRMTRGGYVLATRQADVTPHVQAIPGNIDVDLYNDAIAIQRRFPAVSNDVKNVIHIRRGGDISGQQLGQYFLERSRAKGVRRLQGKVVSIEKGARCRLDVNTPAGRSRVSADIVVNAAGPFINHVANLLGTELPVKNIYQQKIAFEDTRAAIPRDMPFTIDLDRKTFDWSADELEMLNEDESLRWLAGSLPAGSHCRPEGGAQGRWVKLGWAYNEKASEPQEDMANEPAIDPVFPELVIRGAAKLLPSLLPYIATPPARFSHYGGYYTMTEENWPLIGPLDDEGAFIAGALSGFGSMSACAAGKLCATHVVGASLPDYANNLSLKRFDNAALLNELRSSSNKGLL